MNRFLTLIVCLWQLSLLATTLRPNITCEGEWSYTVRATQDSVAETDVFTLAIPDDYRAEVTVSGRWVHENAQSWQTYLSQGGAIRGYFTGSPTSYTMTFSGGGGSFTLNATVSGDYYYVTGRGLVPYKYYYCELSYTVKVKYVRLIPDLTVSSLTASPLEAAVDEDVTLSYGIRNAGLKATSVPTQVKVYAGDVQILGDQTVPALKSGDTFTQTLTLPKLSAGTHVLKVVADAGDVVDESSENNNSATVTLRKYARTPVTVTYDTNGGAASKTFSVVAGNVIGRLPIPEKKGCGFAGWWTQRDGGYRIDALEKITMPRTFYAHWVARTTTIVLNNQGGSGDGSKTVSYGADMPKVAVPSRTGYDFAGYWTEPDGKGVKYYSDGGMGSRKWDREIDTLTLYAKWTPKSGSVTLDAQGGTGGTASVKPSFGVTMPRVTPPTRSEWSFQGYYSSSNGVGVQYYLPSGAGCRAWDRVSESAVTLYGHWLPRQMAYMLVLDRQGGSGGSATVKVTYAAALPKIVPPTRAKYAFDGYYTAPGGKGVKYYDADGNGLMPKVEQTKDVALYAKWVEAFGVRLVPNGAAGSPMTYYFTGQDWILPSCPYSIAGRTFAGWAFEAAGVPTLADGARLNKKLLGYGDQIPEEPVALYAVWGDALQTSLFPGLRFVTGGSGIHPNWYESDGALRSSEMATNSWLCVLLDTRGELQMNLANSLYTDYGAAYESIPCEAIWASERKVYTNLYTSALTTTNSFQPSGHMMTWACRKDLVLQDWRGRTPTYDRDVIQEIWAANTNDLENMVEDLYNLYQGKALSSNSTDSDRQKLREAIRRAQWSYVKHMTQVYLGAGHFECHLDSELRKDGFNSGWLGWSDEYICKQNPTLYTKLLKRILPDMSAIERYLSGFGKLSKLDFRKSCLVAFLLDDGSHWRTAQQAMYRLDDLERVYEAAVGKLGDLFVKAVGGVSLSESRRREAWNCVAEELLSYRRMKGAGLGSIYQHIAIELCDYHGFTGKVLREDNSSTTRAIHAAFNDEFYPCVNEIFALQQTIVDCGVLTTRTVPAPSEIGNLPVPTTPTGFVFDGWWTASRGGGRVTETTQITADVLLYVRWKKLTYALTFETGTSAKCEVRSVAYDEKISSLPTLTRGGYAFAGWAYQSNGKMASIADYISADTVLVAQWTPVTDWSVGDLRSDGWITDVPVAGKTDANYYTLKFATSQGTGTMPDMALPENKVFALPRSLFSVLANKRFAGWACSNGKRYDEGMLVFNLANPGETVTMTAIWE